MTPARQEEIEVMMVVKDWCSKQINCRTCPICIWDDRLATTCNEEPMRWEIKE